MESWKTKNSSKTKVSRFGRPEAAVEDEKENEVPRGGKSHPFTFIPQWFKCLEEKKEPAADASSFCRTGTYGIVL